MNGEHDQREHPRVQAEFHVRMGALEPVGPLQGVDLSRGGLFVRTFRFLPLNAVVRITIELLGGETIPATCRVAYVRDRAASRATGKPAGMGLELLDIDAEKRATLDRLLAGKLSGHGRAAVQTAEAALPKPRLPRPRPAAGVAPVPAPQVEAKEEPEPAAGRSGAPNRLSVIVVDDDERYRELAAEPFRLRGDVVRTTADGLEALAMCLKDPPDIILTDVEMPRMDGWQLLRLVRARPSLASVPVVFLTRLNGDAERLLGYKLGVDAYMAKPYQPEELMIRVHQIVRRARSSSRSPTLRTTLRGELEHVAPPSLLSFIEMEKKSGVLLVVGSGVARIFLREGRVLRAELEGAPPGTSSRDALMTVLDWRSGEFELALQEVSCEDELGMSVTSLILEHAQLADERNR